MEPLVATRVASAPSVPDVVISAKLPKRRPAVASIGTAVIVIIIVLAVAILYILVQLIRMKRTVIKHSESVAQQTAANVQAQKTLDDLGERIEALRETNKLMRHQYAEEEPRSSPATERVELRARNAIDTWMKHQCEEPTERLFEVVKDSDAIDAVNAWIVEEEFAHEIPAVVEEEFAHEIPAVVEEEFAHEVPAVVEEEFAHEVPAVVEEEFAELHVHEVAAEELPIIESVLAAAAAAAEEATTAAAEAHEVAAEVREALAQVLDEDACSVASSQAGSRAKRGKKRRQAAKPVLDL